MRFVLPTLALALASLACAPKEISLTCRPVSDSADVAARPSPYDSVRFNVGPQAASLCYGRPSAKGRTVFGGLVPLDTLWRTGANEPTIIHLPFAAEIAGIQVKPGSYSLYSVPGSTQFMLIVNASTGQWGIESAYNDVRKEEVGRVAIPTDSIEFVEQMTIRAEPAGDSATDLVLEWERTRVRIPIKLAPPA